MIAISNRSPFGVVWLMPLLLATAGLNAQDAAEEELEEEEVTRVNYALIMPEEKMAETVDPDETNPFQSAEDQAFASEDPDTEENKISEILLGLPVTGVSYTTHGMRVLMGDMRLEAGATVPPVLPDQTVQLKVKAITPTAVDLVWVEDKLTGLAPRSLVIPINVAPTVRYLLQGHRADGQSLEDLDAPFVGMKRGRIRGLSSGPAVGAPPPSAPTQEIAGSGEANTPPRATAVADEKPKTPTDVGPGEAVVRMLFGTGRGGQ